MRHFVNSVIFEERPECIVPAFFMQTQNNMEKFTIDKARNYGWMVLSPTDKLKPVALFHRHDHALLFAVTIYGEKEPWEVKSCDIRIPLYCY